MQSHRIPRSLVVALAVSWLAVVGLPPLGLSLIRGAWIERLSRPEVQRQWDEFRGAMRQQTGRDGPVQRKVPKSHEPPQLVWLRDHFALACAAWLLFGSVLWAVTAFFAAGVLPGFRSERITCPGSGDPSAPRRETGRR